MTPPPPPTAHGVARDGADPFRTSPSRTGWKRRCKSDLEYAEGMHLVDQKEVYDTCGYRIRDDLLEGCAVVIFACVLSPSSLRRRAHSARSARTVPLQRPAASSTPPVVNA